MELSELRDLISGQNLRWQAADTEHSSLSDIQKSARLGAVPPADAPSLSDREQLAASRAAAAPEAALPATVDWRDMNGADWVTPIEDQGNCGSCVAFGTVAAFESHVLIARANPKFSVDLSEADLWFCYGPAHGAGQCPAGGWWPDQALPGAVQGITDAACFPYTPANQACNRCSSATARLSSVTSWHSITTTAGMKAFLAASGPLQTCFTVYDDFYSYTGGVYSPANSPSNKAVGGHCVAVVGYDDSNSCWICKNSWGSSFGENGFVRIAYGQCGIDAEMWAIDGVAFYREWIEALYADLLVRAPDTPGWGFWIQYLISGHGLPAAANGFLTSAEYCTDIITGLYQQLLSRAPDPDGLAHWVNSMQAGTALQQIILGFCGSTEFQNNNPVPGAFVESLYERLLGRASDPSGKQFWINALQAHGTTYVINGFLSSQEYCTDRVTYLYDTLLGRQPDPAGLAGWVQSMTSGTAFQQIQSGFLTSAEYQKRALTRFT